MAKRRGHNVDSLTFEECLVHAHEYIDTLKLSQAMPYLKRAHTLNPKNVQVR